MRVRYQEVTGNLVLPDVQICPFCGALQEMGDEGYVLPCKHGEFNENNELVLYHLGDHRIDPEVAFWLEFWRKFELFCKSSYDIGINPLQSLRKRGFRNVKYIGEGPLEEYERARERYWRAEQKRFIEYGKLGRTPLFVTRDGHIYMRK